MAGYPAADRNGSSGDSPSPKSFDTSPIDRLIGRTRRLLRSTWFVTGLCVSIGMLLSTLVLVSLTDLVIPLYPAFRLLGLLTIVLPTSWLLIVGVIRPLCRRLNSVLVARRIEREIPGIHNRLVSCVDLASNGQSNRVSRAFHERLVSEAVDRIRNFNPRSVLDLLTLRRAGLFAGVGALAIFLAFALLSDRMPTALARILQPFADIPPASSVNFDVLVGNQTTPGDYETLRGEDVDFKVLLNRGKIDPPGSDNALKLQVLALDDKGKSKTMWYDFAALEEAETAFKLTGMQQSFAYRVHGGGTWSKKYQVKMLDRPRIVGLQTALYYPEYMRISEPRLGPPQTTDVTGPKESRVVVTVTVEGDAHEGEIQLLQPTRVKEKVVDRSERLWVHGALPVGAKAEGKWQWDEKLTGEKAHFDPKADAVHAHGFSGAPIGFEVGAEDNLYAYVFIPEGERPETIMLKFHDGQNWERRAFWGADKIAEGVVDSPSRQRIGDLPEAGKLVRLEVPATSVDLDGRRLHGVSFAQFGGRAVWGAFGAVPAEEREVVKLAVVESLLLERVKPDATQPPAPAEAAADAVAEKWRGEFQLLRDGFYRVELRNRIGNPNLQMQEGKLQAILDEPPQVVIERPGVNLIVSAPVKVPLYISAYDDYGVEEVVLSVKTGEDGSFQGRPVKRFPSPQRSTQSVTTIDLAEEGLKIGDTLTYRVEVRDGRGQSATTKDYTVRLAAEATAEDKQFAQYEEQTETFQKKLDELITEQKKVQDQVKELQEEFQPLTEQIEEAKAEAAKAEKEKPDPDPKKPAEPTPLKLDDEAEKKLTDLRGKLGELAKQEAQNVERGKQAAAELQKLAEQSAKQQFLPPQIAEQMQNVQQAFQQMAVDPLQQLNQDIKQSAQPKQQDPQLPKIEGEAEQVQQNLEDLKQRVDAMAKAQKESRNDVDQALVDLRDNLRKQDATMASRDLADLRDYLEAMKQDLDVLKGDQEDLLGDATKELSDRLQKALEEEQGQLDEKSDQALADAAKLLDQLRNMDPEFPGRPYDPEKQEVLVPPKEQDGKDADDKDKGEKEKGEKDKADKGEQDKGEKEKGEPGDEQEPDLLLPALGGPQPKLDPRFADRIREMLKQAEENDEGQGAEERVELRARQANQLQELDLAQQAVNSDQKKLEQMLEQFRQMAEGQMTPEQAAQMLQSQDLQQAMNMLQRMQQMKGQLAQSQPSNQPPQNQPGNQPPPPSPNPLSNLDNEPNSVEAILVELDEVDVNTRTVIMKMQPRAREDLLQALREEGPEGYRAFIRDYFRRLTEAQGGN